MRMSNRPAGGARRRAFPLALIGLLVALAPAATPPAPAAAQVPPADEIAARHARLSSELMSPYCRGLTLADCPTSGAAEMRAQIKAWLEEGRSDAWIEDTLVAEWGESILGAPRFRGFRGMLVWLMPGALLIVGGLVLARMLARRGAAPPERASPPVTGEADDDARRRVEAELAELER